MKTTENMGLKLYEDKDTAAAFLEAINANFSAIADTFYKILTGGGAGGKVKLAESADITTVLGSLHKLYDGNEILRLRSNSDTLIFDRETLQKVWKGYLNIVCLNINCGTITSNGNVMTSSAERKTNITPYTGALDKIAALNVFEYDRTDGGHHQIGLIVEDENTPEELIVRSDETVPPIEEGGEPTVKQTAGIEQYSLQCMMIQAFKELKELRDAWQTQMELAQAEMYEAQLETETKMQLAVAEIYEAAIG